MFLESHAMHTKEAASFLVGQSSFQLSSGSPDKWLKKLQEKLEEACSGIMNYKYLVSNNRQSIQG